MPSPEFVIRLGAACAVAVLVLGAINGKLTGDAKIHWDWPLIAAYAVLFFSIAATYRRNGASALAAALAVTAIGAVIFDSIENTLAYQDKVSPAISSGKWIFFFASLALMVPLFLGASGWLPRATGWLLIVAVLAGIAGLFGTPPKSMVPAISIMSVAFILFAVIAVCTPRILLT